MPIRVKPGAWRSAREALRPWASDAEGELLAERVVRFRDPRHRGTPPEPFPAYEHPPEPGGPAGAAVRLRPRFTRVGKAYSAARMEIEPGTSLYGTGEVPGRFLRNGKRIVCYNADICGYDDTAESIYQSHPWVLGVRPDGSAFGVIAETTWRCELDLTKGIAFRSEGPPFGVVVIERRTAQEVLTALADLTGRMPMPPRWALGYHQCRYSYYPEERAVEIATEFRERRIPCDVIWFDIHYMDGYRCFTFDPDHYPDPVRMNGFLHERGYRSVWMIDPGLKADPDYFAYAQGREGDHFVRDAQGNEYNGKVWPGPCGFPDFTRRRTREWWAGLYKDFMATGIDGVWNDMNEPAVFIDSGGEFTAKTMPDDNRHDADPELGGPGPHVKYHNLYGMLMVKATREGIERTNPDKRPFVLTRSNFLGGHRYAATWTGDNVSDWTHLSWSIPMILNLGLSGQPFSGPDIGGFLKEADGSLFARWMGIGALLPFARGHTCDDTGAHEPWVYGEACERTCRRALERRSRLIPYLYTLFHEAHTSGLPVARPLFFADPADPRLRDVEDSFLLGDDILVRASASPDRTDCTAPLPNGVWRTFDLVDTGPEGDPDLPELRLRAGALVPVGPVRQHDAEKPLDPLTLLVSLDDRGTAAGAHYEDEGDGHAHEREQDYLRTVYEVRTDGNEAVVRVREAEGRRPRPDRAIEVIVLTDNGPRHAVGRDGEEIRVLLTDG